MSDSRKARTERRARERADAKARDREEALRRREQPPEPPEEEAPPAPAKDRVPIEQRRLNLLQVTTMFGMLAASGLLPKALRRKGR